jgi:trehalose synthase
MGASARVSSVPIPPLDPARLQAFVGPDRVDRLERTAARIREELAGRRIVNVNSTATGGGVADQDAARVRTRNRARGRVARDRGDPEFFTI